MKERVKKEKPPEIPISECNIMFDPKPERIIKIIMNELVIHVVKYHELIMGIIQIKIDVP